MSNDTVTWTKLGTIYQLNNVIQCYFALRSQFIEFITAQATKNEIL